MKKIFMLAALGGMMLTSCVKNEDLSVKDPKAISFEVATYKSQTRAVVKPLDTTESFGVNAWHNSGSKLTQIMDSETVSHTDSKWQTATQYYWPLSGSVDFVAYYPTTKEPTHDETVSKLIYTDIVVNPDPSNQFDLMYANKAVGYTGNVANGTDLGGFEGVPTVFHHALAKLHFKVQNNHLTEGSYTYHFTVKSITLSGIYSKGSLELNNVDPSTTPGLGSWTLPSPAVWNSPSEPVDTYTWSVTGGLVLDNTDAQAFDEKVVYVLPQVMEANQQKITIIYTLTQYQTIDDIKTEISEVDKTYEGYLKDVATALPSWQMNKDITYTLGFDYEANIILFAPGVADWDTTDGGGVVVK